MHASPLHTAIALLERGAALSPSDLAALQPCDDVLAHWELVQKALALKQADHKASGDNVKPLSALMCDAADMWMYLQLARRIAQLPRTDGAPVVGICAPTGAGKSTLVQLLRMLHVLLGPSLFEHAQRAPSAVQTKQM